MNYDTSANPGPSEVFGNLRAALGGDRNGAFGGESMPRNVAPGQMAPGGVAAMAQSDLASGRVSTKTYRRGVCKSFVSGLGSTKDGLGFHVDSSDTEFLGRRAKESEAVLEAVIAKGMAGMVNPKWVSKSFSGPLAGTINGLNRFAPQSMALQQTAQIWSKQLSKGFGKSFALASPLTSGFVPFDLMPFVRTIYPVNNQAA